MSIRNGYTDVLIRFVKDDNVMVTGASPDGYGFLREKFSTAAPVTIAQSELGPLVSEMVVVRRLSLTITG